MRYGKIELQQVDVRENRRLNFECIEDVDVAFHQSQTSQSAETDAKG